MNDETPSLTDLILQAIDAKLLEVHTGIPCRVESYDVTKGTVNCIPSIGRVIQDEDEERYLESLPRLLNVPVAFPGSGGFSVTFPIAAGDYVLVVFCESPVGEWAHSEGTDPMDERRHSLAGAIAIPGIRPTSKASTDATTDKIVLGGGPVYLGSKTAAEALIKGTTLDGWLTQVNTFFTTLLTTFNTHTHVLATAVIAGAPGPANVGDMVTGVTAIPIPVLTPVAQKPVITSSIHKLDQ